MSPHLEDIPNEITENVVLLLELNDICSLRLTCMSLAFKAAQGHFGSFFRSKYVDITEASLAEFVAMTRPGRLGCLVEELTLVGVVNNTLKLEQDIRESLGNTATAATSDTTSRSKHMYTRAEAEMDLRVLRQRQASHKQFHDSGRDVLLLSHAFCNIAANSRTGRLESLSLDTVVYRQDTRQRFPPAERDAGGWKPIWRSAAETFCTTMHALAASQLEIKRLDVFSQVHRCSVACDKLYEIDWEDERLAVSFRSLKSLLMSISERINDRTEEDTQREGDMAEPRDLSIPDTERPVDIRTSEAKDERNFAGFPKMLQLCGQLEELDLHYYCLTDLKAKLPVQDQNNHRKGLLQQVVATDRLPPATLKQCRLRGLYTTEHDLLTFVKRTSVFNLSMDHVTILSGTFQAVFDYCSSEDARMEYLSLYDLRDPPDHRIREILFHRNEPDDTLRLERTGIELKEPIIYDIRRRREIASGSLYRRRQNRRLEYGPPRYATRFP